MSATTQRPLILASASPRRRELLARAGLTFEVIPSHVSESIGPDVDPGQAAMLLAARKAREVARKEPDAVIIASDTLVVVDSDVLGKPVDEAEARTMLECLRGREHRVISALVVLDPAGGRIEEGVVETRVRMRKYSRAEVEAYLKSGEPRDKAGSYAIQGRGGGLVKSFSGCFNNVVGLPLCELSRILARLSIPLPLAGVPCSLPDGSPCPRLSPSRS